MLSSPLLSGYSFASIRSVLYPVRSPLRLFVVFHCPIVQRDEILVLSKKGKGLQRKSDFFKSSSLKKDEVMVAIPTNLHVQVMVVEEKAVDPGVPEGFGRDPSRYRYRIQDVGYFVIRTDRTCVGRAVFLEHVDFCRLSFVSFRLASILTAYDVHIVDEVLCAGALCRVVKKPKSGVTAQQQLEASQTLASGLSRIMSVLHSARQGHLSVTRPLDRNVSFSHVALAVNAATARDEQDDTPTRYTGDHGSFYDFDTEV